MKLPTITDHTGIRRSGQSTRLIDAYIQRIFNGEKVVISDHHWGFGESKTESSILTHRRCSEDLLKKLLRRMEIEHHIEAKHRPDGVYLQVSRRDLTVELMCVKLD